MVALAISVIFTAFYLGGSSSPTYGSDLDQVWYGSRALLRGLDPYSVVGPGLGFDRGFPLYYPLPALIAFAPLALLPLEVARLVFVSGSTLLLAYAVTSHGWHRLWIFLSGAYLASLAAVQWAPLLTAAFLLPWLGPVLLIKPNIGTAILAASASVRLLAWTVLGGSGLLLLSFIIDPAWLPRWLNVVRSGPHFTPPVLYAGGPLVLLALLRWRRPEARLLVALACVPHTTMTYEALPLLLIGQTWRQSLLLAGLSFLTLILQFPLDVRISATDPDALAAFTDWVEVVGRVTLALVYLPATIMVLRRPNEGVPPAWIMFLRRSGHAH